VTTNSSIVCDCWATKNFLEVAPKTKMIALVKIKKYLTFKKISSGRMPISMQAEIIEVYNGIEARKTITVWGDNGALCRPYLTKFKKDELFVIAFYNAGETKKEKKTDYQISVCGTYWLKVKSEGEEKYAIGNIGDNLSQIKLEELKEKLK